jgi:hypothetical protein
MCQIGRELDRCRGACSRLPLGSQIPDAAPGKSQRRASAIVRVESRPFGQRNFPRNSLLQRRAGKVVVLA